MPTINYRKNPLPVIFTKIPYVRKEFGAIQDCLYPENIKAIEILRRITLGEACVSETEGIDEFVIAISNLKEITDFTGNSHKTFSYDVFRLKFQDVCYWIKGQPPAGEAISYAEAGLKAERIRDLAIECSCVELFRKCESTFGMEKYAHLSKKDEQSILEKESFLFGEMNLQKIKNSYGLSGAKKNKSSKARIQREHIPERIRHEVWRRDVGKCVECDSIYNLEFDHVIPVAKGGSNTARNLRILCELCNRRKSDNIG